MNLDRLLAHPAVQEARSRVYSSDRRTLAEQLELVAIPAPPSAKANAATTRCPFARLWPGRRNRSGRQRARHAAGVRERGAPPILLAAHLDTVFPAETELAVRRRGTRIYAPGHHRQHPRPGGCSSPWRGVVDARIPACRPLVFVATVGEEGVGDLRGVKHLFREGAPWRNAAGFVALDGSGVRRIVHRAVGSCRFRVRVQGPGGHSWADRGVPNPIHALGAAVGGIRMLVADVADSVVSIGKSREEPAST